MVYLVGMKYLNIKEAKAIIGKSERTIRGKVANLSKEDKKRFIKRGNKNALLISEKWLLNNFKGVKENKKDYEIYERLLSEKEARIKDLQLQIEDLNRHLTQANAIIRETNLKGMKLIEGDKKENWITRIFNKKII